MSEHETPESIVIERTLNDVVRSFVRGLVGTSVMLLFLVYTATLALRNLVDMAAIGSFHVVGAIGSVLWLGLVALFLAYILFHKDGVTRTLITTPVILLAPFSRCHVIDIAVAASGANTLRCGFRLFDRSFIYRRFAVLDIDTVIWHWGQGSDRLGKDRNDWSVNIWLDHGDPAKNEGKRKSAFDPDREVFTVGLFSGKKEDVADYGRRIVALLNRAGANLIQGKDDCRFVRKLEGSSSEGSKRSAVRVENEDVKSQGTR